MEIEALCQRTPRAMSWQSLEEDATPGPMGSPGEESEADVALPATIRGTCILPGPPAPVSGGK